MFFLLRSTLCIGLVVSALPHGATSADRSLDDLVHGAGTSTTAALARFCAAHPDRCLLPIDVTAAEPPSSDGAAPRRLRSVPGPEAAAFAARRATVTLVHRGA